MNRIVELNQSEIAIVSGGISATHVGGVLGAFMGGFLSWRITTFVNGLFLSKILGNYSAFMEIGGVLVGVAVGNFVGRTCGFVTDYVITSANNIYEDFSGVISPIANMTNRILGLKIW